MRKYHQAALAIIATISLVALLFYRHEYNRLRYVLEVFDYFGKPAEMELYNKNCTGLCSIDNIRCNFTSSDYSTSEHFDDPIPSWQRLNDEIYIYSAYAISDTEIRAVSFAKSKKMNLISCKVLYENNIEPVSGEFSYKTIESSGSIGDGENASKGIYRAYHLVCRHKNIEKKPVGVIFASRAERSKLNVDIILSVKQLDLRANDDRNEIGICVAPSNARPIVNTDMINFISFHNSLGMERFIVYDFGIPQRFNNIFKHIARQSGAEFNLRYSTIPWNFPFARIPVDVGRRVVQADCLYRLFNKVHYVVTLTWDEYIIMKYHRTIVKLFRDIDKTGLISQRYKLSTINLCLDRVEKLDDEEPIVFGNGEIVENRPVYIHRSITNTSVFDDEDAKSRGITSDIIVVNRYERYCNLSGSYQLNRLDDPHFGKFSKIVQESPIYKLFRLYI